MGFQSLIVLTFLVFAKDYQVTAQYVVECVPQATTAIAKPIVQSCGQLVIPAVVQPIIPAYETYVPDTTAISYSTYGNYPSPYPGYPTVIIQDDTNFWKQLLYVLIFSLQNKRTNYCNTPPSYGCGCGCGCNSCNCCSGGCGCSCRCSCHHKNNNDNKNNSKNNIDNTSSAPTYIPIPFAVPFFAGFDGCPYFDYPEDESNIIIQPSQETNGRDNEINLCIRVE